MPGRVLVFDPIVTNRIMLKTQLSIDFFDVSLAADLSELHSEVRLNKPDLVLVSYHADRSTDFKAVRWLKSIGPSAYIPVVFLQNSDDSCVWDQSHELMVDDVLHYRASKWLMTARLNVLIRSKGRLDAIAAQGRTITDMGFAETSFVFPPPAAKPIRIDLSLASGSFDEDFIATLAKKLSSNFPNLDLRAHSSIGKRKPADLYVVDPEATGTDVAFAQMIALRRAQKSDAPNLLFIAGATDDALAQRALEFGASDFALQGVSPEEITCRIRRILWHAQVAHQAEKSISKHLQSALIDPLTGLYNRRYALQHLNRLLRDRTHPNSTVTAMVVDLDHFKRINDTYGHLTGDAVIRQTAKRLKNNLRSTDHVARLGGEEFLIILENASAERVRSIAERMRREISSKSFLTDAGDAITVSASIGVSASKSDWTSSNAIIECADGALYCAKDTGRDRVTFSEKAA